MKTVKYQEDILEEIVAYSIQAGEILTKEIKITEPKYRRLFLPKGPELYTGPLKAAGYLLLDPLVRHVILVYNQSSYPDHITVLDNKDGILSLGKKIIVETLDLKHSKKVTKMDDEMYFESDFLRIIKDITHISIIGIGINIQREEFIAQINSILKNKEVGLVFYDVCSQDKERSITRKHDETTLNNIINKKLDIMKGSTWLANMFVQCLSPKTKPHLLGYVNTGDFDNLQQKVSSYVSLVG